MNWDNGKENGNYCLGFWVWGLGFWVLGVWGLGFRVLGFRGLGGCVGWEL